MKPENAASAHAAPKVAGRRVGERTHMPCMAANTGAPLADVPADALADALAGGQLIDAGADKPPMNMGAGKPPVDISAGKPRVGIYGGAFDPPHNAHVALAAAAVRQLALDSLHVIPTGSAVHKARPLTAAHHRLAMCRLAFGGVPRTVVDAREMQRGGVSYTIDTLRSLRAEHPSAALFLIIGADQAAAFHTWRQADEIVRIATLCIAERAMPAGESTVFFHAGQPSPAWSAAQAQARQAATQRACAATAPPAAATPAQCPSVHRPIRLQLPALPHSSSQVRARLAAGQGADGLLPAAVARYIAAHFLYQTPQA